MKKFASLLVLAFLASSCIQEAEPELAEKSTLLVSQHNVALTSAQAIDTAMVSLSCGCRFDLVVESFSGDTNVIRFNEFEAHNDAWRVALAFSGESGAPAGTYDATLALLSTGSKGDFRDTIHVQYTR